MRVTFFAEFCADHNQQLLFHLPYEKGDMPFALTDRHLATLIENSSADFPHSEFALFIKQLLPSE